MFLCLYILGVQRTCSQVASKVRRAFGHLHVMCRRELETVRMVGCDAQGAPGPTGWLSGPTGWLSCSSDQISDELSKDVGGVDG